MGEAPAVNVDQLLQNLNEANGENAVELVNENVTSDTDLQINDELTAIKEIDVKAEKFKQMQAEENKQMASPSTALANESPSLEEKREADERSIYVGNVDYDATAEELESHFHECGTIKRVKIQLNKADGRPKGFAYIKFAEKEFAALALDMDETLFRDRTIKVMPKRTNCPGMSTTNRYASFNKDQLLKNLDEANDENAYKLEYKNVATDTNNQFNVELTAIMESFKELDEETEKIKQMQAELNKQLANISTAQATTEPLSLEEKREVDERSIYVGNVEYGATEEELESHFLECGTIKRVKIQLNKADNSPKGFAFIEFAEKEFVALALNMNATLFRGRAIKVLPKRTNCPGMSTTNRFARGSFRGRIGGSFRNSRAASGSTRRPVHNNFYAPY